MDDARSDTGKADTRRWRGRTQGTGAMHRALIWMLGRWPLGVFYVVAALFVVPGYIIATPRARHALRLFYGHVGLKATPMTYFRSYYSFAKAIIDRFAAYAGRRFNITMVDNEIYRTLESGEGGFVMLGSHEGNYELTGYSLQLKSKPLNALLFGGEARVVMQGRRRLFAGNNINIITVAPGSLDHVFAISEALHRGEIVSIPADRTFGSDRRLQVKFSGAYAGFPMGPFVLAATYCVPVIAVFMIKTGYRDYRLTVRSIGTAGCDAAAGTRARAEALCKRYVSELEAVVREYPYQWYNYYDFWGDEDK